MKISSVIGTRVLISRVRDYLPSYLDNINLENDNTCSLIAWTPWFSSKVERYSIKAHHFRKCRHVNIQDRSLLRWLSNVHLYHCGKCRQPSTQWLGNLCGLTYITSKIAHIHIGLYSTFVAQQISRWHHCPSKKYRLCINCLSIDQSVWIKWNSPTK